jgi:hypothetical protein
MNRETIEIRIDELEIRKKALIKKRKDLEREIARVEGRIEERWDELNSWRDKGEYGHRTLEGGTRVMKLPEFKTQAEMGRALSGEPFAIGDADEGEVTRARESRARFDAQQAVDILDGKSPYEDDIIVDDETVEKSIDDWLKVDDADNR